MYAKPMPALKIYGSRLFFSNFAILFKKIGREP